jgi:hypothetical protein
MLLTRGLAPGSTDFKVSEQKRDHHTKKGPLQKSPLWSFCGSVAAGESHKFEKIPDPPFPSG